MLVFCVYSYSQVYTCKNELVNSANISCDLNNTELAAIDYHLFNSNGIYYYLGINISPKTLLSDLMISYYESNKKMQAQWLKNGSWTVKGYAHNSCGSTYQTLYVNVSGNGGGGGSVKSPPYPNPVSDILYIEIDAQAVSNSRSQQPGQTGVDPSIDIRLYDGQGNLLQQTTSKGGIVQFNVSNLLDGIYYLHIYDGVSVTPFMAQIVVEH